MKSDKVYFRNVGKYGNLYFKYSLLDFENEPVLFVCCNADSKLFLCYCSDIRNEQTWIVTKTTQNTLDDLTNHRIDILTAIRKCSGKKVVIKSTIDGNEESTEIQFTSLDELDLPKSKLMLR